MFFHLSPRSICHSDSRDPQLGDVSRASDSITRTQIKLSLWRTRECPKLTVCLLCARLPVVRLPAQALPKLVDDRGQKAGRVAAAKSADCDIWPTGAFCCRPASERGNKFNLRSGIIDCTHTQEPLTWRLTLRQFSELAAEVERDDNDANLIIITIYPLILAAA